MAANIDRFKTDYKRLLTQAGQLENALQLDVEKDLTMKEIRRVLGSEDAVNSFVKSLPNFRTNYDTWYSECIVLIKQLLPDRLDNFKSLYEKSKTRKELTHANYVIQDYLQGLSRADVYGQNLAHPRDAFAQFRQQVSILNAVNARFESTLFEIRQMVQADLFDSEIKAARELSKHKFHRAAGAVAGVILERHLRQVCDIREVKITKTHPSISELNEILKNSGIVDVPQWRHISMLADIRNLCAHNKLNEPTEAQVNDLIDGTEKVIKTVA